MIESIIPPVPFEFANYPHRIRIVSNLDCSAKNAG